MPENLKEKGRGFLERQKARYEFATEREVTLYVLSKLMEEAGELSDEVLGELQLQRKQKLEKRDGENIRKEFSDVIVALSGLATQLNIDIDEIIKETLQHDAKPR